MNSSTRKGISIAVFNRSLKADWSRLELVFPIWGPATWELRAH